MAPIIKWILISAFGIFLVLQLVAIPTLAKQTNPPVVQEPNWDSEQTRSLARRACFDCHSNETRWPIYSRIAPIAWVVTDHVIEGRQALNFSDWGAFDEEAEEFAEVINEGKMPLPDYLKLHPEARLSAAEKQQLIAGLYATVNNSPGQRHEANDGTQRNERETDDDDDDD